MNEQLQNEVNVFLDDLREEGSVNMVGAGPYLELEFALEKREARTALQNWMSSK